MAWLPLETYRITVEAYLDRRSLDVLSIQVPELDHLTQDIETTFLRHNSSLAKTKTALPEGEGDVVKDGFPVVSSRLLVLGSQWRDMLDER